MPNRYGTGIDPRAKQELMAAFISQQQPQRHPLAGAAQNIANALMFRKMMQEQQAQQQQNQQAQQEIARSLMGGQNPQNLEAAMFNQQNPGELGMVQTTPQKLPDQGAALQQALANPQALASNPMLAQVMAQQMAPQESYTLAPGAVRMQGNRKVAENPEGAGKPSNLEQMLALTGLKPGSPEYQQAAQNYINKPGVQITNEYGSIPAGYKRIKDPKSPTGTRLVQEEGAPQAKLPAETAAKVGMLDASEKSLAEAEKVLFPDGKFDRGAVTATWSPVRTGKAATLYNSMRDAVSNRLRAESGASITDSDINDATERFLPKPWDSKEEAEARIRRFRQFVSSYRSAVTNQQQNVVKFDDYPEDK